jgi:hypothetical protein
MPGLGLAHHGVIRALLRLFPFDLRWKAGERAHDLVHRGVELALLIAQIEPHLHARVRELLEGIGGFDLLTAKP